MVRKREEPFQWRQSRGLLHQWMLREYMRWLFPQLGRAYEPPQGVRDYTAPEVSRLAGEQPEPFRPRAASGPVLRSDLEAFAAYCFEALEPYSERNPYKVRPRCRLTFITDLRRLHAHLMDLLTMKRRAEQTAA